tara:strand:+ start:944 stop:3208 length:2265 start_codon:yes stop_codon:yes gene_type:complete
MTMPNNNSRILLKRLKKTLSELGEAQARLNKIVKIIANSMNSEVCSIYLINRHNILELYATEGLRSKAVHYSQLNVGQGLVGKIAATAEPIKTSQASKTKGFRYLPETGEEIYNSFLGVPIQRLGKILGVLVIQNLKKREFTEDDVYGLEIVAMVIAEMAELGIFTSSDGSDELSQDKKNPLSINGLVGKEGIIIGNTVLLEPQIKIQNPIADNTKLEKQKLKKSISKLNNQLSEIISKKHFKKKGDFLEILETHKLLIEDRSWIKRMESSIDSGLSAIVAVEKEQTTTKSRIAKVKNFYFKERLNEFYEISNILLKILTNQKTYINLEGIKEPILIARNISPLELVSLRHQLKGIILEDGSVGSHTTIVSRALNIPLLIQTKDIINKISNGDKIILDAEQGLAYLRPDKTILELYISKLKLRNKAKKTFLASKNLETKTLDNKKIFLMMNAGLMADLPSLDDSGADGVGLYRTELQFLISNKVPKRAEQAEIYCKVLDSAGTNPVFFRTLDIGSDKILPTITPEIEPNPTLGWRAIRLTLERSGVFKMQVQALIRGAKGRNLNIVIPLVTEINEFLKAKDIILDEINREKKRNRIVPNLIKIGAMLEVPSLVFAPNLFFKSVDFLMVGGNDLKQFFFAADRENEKVRKRYDMLSTSFLSFLKLIVKKSEKYKLPLSYCGEDAGKPIEALVLCSLGFKTLSMQPNCIAPVKSLLRNIKLSEIKQIVEFALEANYETVRNQVVEYLEEIKYIQTV